MQLTVKYAIGDTVVMNDGTDCRVIGYRYVETMGIQYIVLRKDDRKYLYEIEVTKHTDVKL